MPFYSLFCVVRLNQKLKSSNDKKEIKDDKLVENYYPDWTMAKDSKYYELVQNWTILRV